MHEKRRHPRVAVQIPISCRVGEAAPFPGEVVDISVGGLYVHADVSPAFGAEIVLTGDFPGAPGLTLPAVVRWAKPGGFGVQFGLIGASATHALAAIMKGRK